MPNLRTLARAWFLDHPHAVNETYFQHWRTAWSFALRLIAAGIACLIHAIVPRLFTNTGSRMIDALHRQMILGRVRNEDAGDLKQQLAPKRTGR